MSTLVGMRLLNQAILHAMPDLSTLVGMRLLNQAILHAMPGLSTLVGYAPKHFLSAYDK
ncbi:hypothetical protein [Streptococcus agalactiae]